MTLAVGLTVGIALGLVALLCVPVDVAVDVAADMAVDARRRERLAARVRLRWLFGLVPLPAGGATPERAEKKKKKKRRRPGRRARNGRRALAVAQSRGFVRRVARLVRDLLARVRVRRMEVTVRIGLDNPADTGRLWGVVGPVVALLPVPAGASVAVAPEFTGAAFDVDAACEARVVPAAVLLTLLAFFLAPATLRALYAAARA